MIVIQHGSILSDAITKFLHRFFKIQALYKLWSSPSEVGLQSLSRSKISGILIPNDIRIKKSSPYFRGVWQLHLETNHAKNSLTICRDLIRIAWPKDLYISTATKTNKQTKITGKKNQLLECNLPVHSPDYFSRALDLFINIEELKICHGILSLRLLFLLEFLLCWETILNFKKQFMTSFLVVCLHLVSFTCFSLLFWHLRQDLLKVLGTVLLTEVEGVKIDSTIQNYFNC